ncbi:MAG: SDR family NAD(P)-dependent oxidoreductase [Granulosicoccus sp.]
MSRISFHLDNTRALVTGAASGIGLATAELLARSGAHVAMNDLPGNARLEQETERLSGLGLRVLAAPGDTGSAASANAMTEKAIDTLGGLDYLVNNAGTPGTSQPIAPSDFEAQNEAFWEKLLSVNLQGPWRCLAAASHALQDAGGAVVNTASIAGFYGNGSSAVYCATKAALISLTREHARVLGPRVRVNAIAPGYVDSEWECRFDRPQQSINALPLQRIGQPQDYANGIVWLLASADYVTGHVLVMDGGLTLGPRPD